MSRSTSSAAWPGHCVTISTIGGERSGYASTGSRFNDQIPAPTSTNVISTTRNGWRSDENTTRFIIEAVRDSGVPGGRCALIGSA